jgi:hypothetical protein
LLRRTFGLLYHFPRLLFSAFPLLLRHFSPPS